MRRFLAGFLAAGLLAFVGLQAAHAHGDESRAPQGCSVCALGSQSVRALPTAAAAPAPLSVWSEAAPAPAVRHFPALRREAAARAPPTF